MLASVFGAGRRAWRWVRDRLAPAPLAVLLVLAIAFYASFVDRDYPIQHWLFFPYARCWGLSTFFAASCVCSGTSLLRSLLPTGLRLEERLLVGFSLGVLVFVWGLFVAGLLGILGRAFFFGWPCLLLATGSPGLLRSLRRPWRRLSPFGARLFLPRGGLDLLSILFIALSLAGLYLQSLTPLNLGPDTHWYHLPIAEGYAATGAIRPFEEGWYLGAYPQLASLLYTWAFLAPGKLFDHCALATHLEWTLFLATLVGVSVLARRLLSNARVPFAAAAVFLFPGVFLFDSNLVTGADHVLAFWAPPLAVALCAMGRRFGAREATIAALMTAGAVLTKYQASYLFVPAALATWVFALWKRHLVPALVWSAVLAAASSAHWLKNWIFYGDPFYPLLHRYFPAHPFHAGASVLFDRFYWVEQFSLTGTPTEKLLATLRALAAFAFEPHDWSSFHGDTPVFGALFTLLVPTLVFLRPPRRLWMLAVAVHIGVAVWFVTSHEDRFLQALLPWMAACTASMLALAWRRGWIVRVPVMGLVSLQAVWGGDVYFFPTHSMIGDAPLKATIDLLGAGHRHQYKDRFRLWGNLQDMGRVLPKDARVLGHDWPEKLGLGTSSISDQPGFQGAIDYLLLDSPQATLDLWRKLRVTHVWWLPHAGHAERDLVAREVIFQRAAREYTREPRDFGPYRLEILVYAPRDERALEPTRVAWLTCGREGRMGLYTARGLAQGRPESTFSDARLEADAAGALSTVNAAVLDRSCGAGRRAIDANRLEFELVKDEEGLEIWLRTGDAKR